MEIHRDQERNLESGLFHGLCSLLGMVKTRITLMHPQSDAMVERFNLSLVKGLAKVIQLHQRRWGEWILLFLLALRTAQHDSIKNALAEMLFGRQLLKLPIDLKLGSPPQRVEEVQDNVCDHDSVRTQICSNSNRIKARYDLKALSTGFLENDLAWFYNPTSLRTLKTTSRLFRPKKSAQKCSLNIKIFAKSYRF